jgi:hypothetical protein
MITITNIPPQIFQFYNRALLTGPHKLCDDSSNLDSVYRFIKYKIDKKPIGNKVYQLEKQYLELDERIKVKEKVIEGETGHITKRPFYRFEMSNKKGRDIFERLRYKREKLTRN